MSGLGSGFLGAVFSWARADGRRAFRESGFASGLPGVGEVVA
jgi:hypothetical protein